MSPPHTHPARAYARTSQPRPAANAYVGIDPHDVRDALVGEALEDEPDFEPGAVRPRVDDAARHVGRKDRAPEVVPAKSPTIH